MTMDKWYYTALVLIVYDIIKIIILSRLTAKEVRKEKERWRLKNGKPPIDGQITT